MSALRNVGELATPYFLLELWAQREQVEVDPGLKTNARKLVRDARGFETRGEEPDDEWRQRRLDLFALAGVSELPIELGNHGNLGIWRDSNGRDALLVGDLEGFVDVDVRPKDADDPLATTFELALDEYEGDADWGLLLAGLEARVYRRSSGIAQQYLAMDLDSLVELDDEPTWRAFAGIFRSPAFSYGADDTPLIRRIVDESRRHASALANDMRADVVDAAEAIIQGALDHPGNAEVLGDRSRAILHQLFEETLYYLYRILFVLYAEARDVLPISGLTPYATTYSIDHLIERARTEGIDIEGSYFDDSLRRLFAVLWNGPQEATEALGIQAVGGELFDPSRTALMDVLAIPDRAWRRALTAIALGKEGSQRRKAGRRASFSELGVDQLGSIYEGLLVLEPYLALGPRLLVRNGDRRVVEAGMEGGLKVERELDSGDFVLESASGRRKGSGSFYTPVEITEYLVHAAIDPLTEPLVELAATDPQQAEGKLLALKICDPAMGSGAFLVQAARSLGLALARIRAARKDGRATPDAISRAKRLVVRRCLYGVDLNPLAVALAKVSLWLEILEKGRPLTFLDAHLRVGNSLVGVEFAVSNGSLRADELTQWPYKAVDGLKKYLRAEAGEPGIAMLERLKERKKSSAVKQDQIPGTQSWAIEEALAKIAAERVALTEGEETLQLELEAAKAFEELEQAEDSLRNRLRAAADFWCAQWFAMGEDSRPDVSGNPVLPATVGDFELIVAKLLSGEPLPKHLQAQVDAAAQVKEQRHFFHWALEFPEAVVDRGGFDAVVGNPPWNTLSPDVKEFFSTYDPITFAKRKGAPKKVQDTRKAELRDDPEIDAAWRNEARFLYELSAYAKPDAGRFHWYATEGQLRKGDANVFRLFVERAYRLLRPKGYLAQVLPDSVYMSAPATGVREHLLQDGQLQRCYVFENRHKIFPIHSGSKVVLLTAQSGGDPTVSFRSAFFVGKGAAGEDRTVGVEELPAVLSELDESAAFLRLDQIRALSPQTLAFPELQTDLDAEVVAQCLERVPPLNLGPASWALDYAEELHSERDAWRFRDAEFLEGRGAARTGLRWKDPDGDEWWPLIEGSFYHLEFPALGKEPHQWVQATEVQNIPSKLAPDGTSIMEHYRMAWRRVTASTNERGAISVVLPPRTAAKDSTLTVRGGSISNEKAVVLAALVSSFIFDYLVRFSGRINLRYSALSSVSAPGFDAIQSLTRPAAEAICLNSEFDELWTSLGFENSPPQLTEWERASRRALIDARVALAYGLSLEQFCAALSSFPNLDKIQPRISGEPKSFVTRDLALLAFCEAVPIEPPLIDKLLSGIGVDIPVNPDYRRVDERVVRYREIGAVPYRPTPRGGRVPTDPALIEDIVALVSEEAKTAGDIAEALEETEKIVKAVLKSLERDGDVFAEGKGRNRRYYVVGGDN